MSLTMTACTQSNPTAGSTQPPSSSASEPHASHGPHDGILVELGNEEFHAELLLSASSVTVYILDNSAKNANPIEATDITLNCVHDGKPAQYKLAANPDSGDPEGKTSRFVSDDAALASLLKDEHTTTKLNLTIAGKAYQGSVAHDHANHSHSH